MTFFLSTIPVGLFLESTGFIVLIGWPTVAPDWLANIAPDEEIRYGPPGSRPATLCTWRFPRHGASTRSRPRRSRPNIRWRSGRPKRHVEFNQGPVPTRRVPAHHHRSTLLRREIGLSRRRLLASAPQPRCWSRAAPEAAARSQAAPQGGLSAGQYGHQEIQPSRDGYQGIVC